MRDKIQQSRTNLADEIQQGGINLANGENGQD